MSTNKFETCIKIQVPAATTTTIKKECNSSLTILEAEAEVKNIFQPPSCNDKNKTKRKRNAKSALRACDYCQYRKIRCSRNELNQGNGGCSACVARGITCTFLNPTKRNQKLGEPTIQLRSNKIKYLRPRNNSKKENKQGMVAKPKVMLGDSPKSDVTGKIDNNSSNGGYHQNFGTETTFPTCLKDCIFNCYLDKSSQLYRFILGLVEQRNLIFKDSRALHINILANFYKFVYTSLPLTDLNINGNVGSDYNNLLPFQNSKFTFNLILVQSIFVTADASFFNFVINLMTTSLGILIELYTFDGSHCKDLTIKYYDLSINQLYLIFDNANVNFKNHCLNLLDLLYAWAKLLINNGVML